ncbi:MULTISPECIES: redox-sensing transcriptional repressor Rex [Cetobacterium]|jgi:redox-sensing transcriptional repressor|uniref:Redox-sensing transcriptional repressor Rex n=1 Tax=Candidatus Cetobacterium colombiensis TaxID=3073100 RepID=A0ABU4WB43_9FUSO|nr:redox-sensing transcriptional repressor Rex [Candidatus Cetobacterium colombiensis]MDX8336247.1 redox-sensing transcriptional repressor Rex [Candidatus Cetobacterium colombiensis]
MKTSEKKEKISRKTIQRLTMYLKCLEKFSPDDYISSEEMGVLLGVTAAQIRKDFSSFITNIETCIGIRGKGYNVKCLYEMIENILGINKQNNVIIVGAGKLGNAILLEGDIEKPRFNIVGIFDITKSRIGKEYKGIKISSVSDIPKIASEQRIDMAIITENKSIAQQVTDIVTQSGIKAILNMTSLEIKVPRDVVIEHIDLNRKLQELNYWKEKAE